MASWRLCSRGQWRGSGKGCSASRWSSCPLLGSRDPFGALIELPAARTREAAAHLGTASCLFLGFWRSPWCSACAGGAVDPDGSLASLLT